jgi:hypothetical protein
MRTSKFSLADLLTVASVAVFGFFCFLSFNFLSFGKTSQSILLALAIALIIGALALGIKLLKTTNGNFKTCIIAERILLFLFVCVALIASYPFSHYFTVLDQKTEIQAKVTANITQAESMFADYEKYAANRKDLYKRRLISVVADKIIRPGDYHDYGFVEGTNDSTQVENKMFTLQAQLFPTNYEGDGGIKQVAVNWLTGAKNTLESKWAFTFGIVPVIQKSQANITSWKDELKRISSFRAQGESTNDFDYALTFDDVTGKFENLGNRPAISIGVSAGLYFLMLLSYFVSKRSTKNHYSLFSFIIRKKSSQSTDIDIVY